MAVTDSRYYRSMFSQRQLEAAFDHVLSSALTTQGSEAQIDRVRTKSRLLRLRAQRDEIIQELIELTHEGQDLHLSRFLTKIPKTQGGKPERPISVFPVKQRILLRAMHQRLSKTLTPALSGSACYCVVSPRRKVCSRGALAAIGLLSALRKTNPQLGIIEADVQSFFDEIDREILLETLAPFVYCEQTKNLIRLVLEAETRIDPRYYSQDESPATVDGIPQGASISSLLATVYLTPFDRRMRERGAKMVRYVDDFVLCYKNSIDLDRELNQVREILGLEFKLGLAPNKTSVLEKGKDLESLGFAVSVDGRVCLSKKRVKAVRRKLMHQIGRLPGNDESVAEGLTSFLLGLFHTLESCPGLEPDYPLYARYIKCGLNSAELDQQRLTKRLAIRSKKWPQSFLEELRS